MTQSPNQLSIADPENIRVTVRSSKAIIFCQSPWNSLIDLTTECVITNRTISLINGIFDRNIEPKDLCYLRENVKQKRLMMYRLIDLIRRLFNQPPILMADIYIYSIDSYTSKDYLMRLKGIPEAYKVEGVLRHYIQIDKTRRGVRILEK